MNYRGVVGVLSRRGVDYRLTVYAAATHRRIAVVEGSPRYVRTALLALGLAAPPVAGLAEHGHGPRVALVRRKPTYRRS